MPAVLIGAAVALVGGVVVLGIRRLWKRRDPVVAFSAATDALKHIADGPRVEVASSTIDEEETPNVHVLHDIAVLRLDRTRPSGSRRARERQRPDPEVLARRPLVASLPLLASDRVRVAGDAAEQG